MLLDNQMSFGKPLLVVESKILKNKLASQQPAEACNRDFLVTVHEMPQAQGRAAQARQTGSTNKLAAHCAAQLTQNHMLRLSPGQ